MVEQSSAALSLTTYLPQHLEPLWPWLSLACDFLWHNKLNPQRITQQFGQQRAVLFANARKIGGRYRDVKNVPGDARCFDWLQPCVERVRIYTSR